MESMRRNIKNLSNNELTRDQITLLSRGLKFIPTPVPNEDHIRRQLLNDHRAFASRLRLKYIFHGQNKEPYPFHVKSNWEPPIQPSVALETYLEEVKTQLADVKIITPKNRDHNCHYENRRENKRRADTTWWRQKLQATIITHGIKNFP